ncbi:MAG: hypothetical protein RIF32_19640 [Leptospirales bacterium]|jgi:hypothetical protein
MKESTIADDFLGKPNSLYDAPEKLSPEARRELFELEEALAATLLFGPVRAPAENEAERIAVLADQLLNSDEYEPQAADREFVARAYQDARIMQDPALVSEALPDVLKLVLERSLGSSPAVAGKAASIPSIVLQIRDGLQVVKSAFQGLALQTESIVATRNAVAAPEARRSHVVLNQKVQGRDLEYEILSESQNAVTLTVRILNGGTLNKIRVVLRCEGRMLDSRSPDASGQLGFEHLGAGSYELEFTGALRHTCPILIQD